MPTRIEELQEKRAKLTRDARVIYDKADTEKRGMTAEETAAFDAHMNEVDTVKGEIDAIEQRNRAAERMAAAERDLTQSRGRTAVPDKPSATLVVAPSEAETRAVAKMQKREKMYGKDIARRSGGEYRSVFNAYCKTGRSMFHSGMPELRALQADADIVGGYLIPPIQFVNKLILFLKDLVFIRQLANVIPVNAAQSLGIPSLDADPADSDWTSELATGNADSTMAVGRRDLSPHPLAKRILVSNKLLRLAPNVESLLLDRLGYKFAITEEKAFMTGSGAQQPLGVFTASANGIPTGQDISTGNTTTAVTADGLMEAKYNLKYQYQARGVWMFHRSTVKMIRKLKDANGQYIWSAGLGGEPDSMLERPVYMSEYVPNTYTTGLYVGIFGDFSFYYIADALNMQMQRLDELYAETNQVEYIGRREMDAMPVLAEAFTRVKLA